MLPLVTNCWDGMSDDERNGLCGINNSYCGLHFVVGPAEQAQETLKRWEKAHRAAPAIGGIQRNRRSRKKSVSSWYGLLVKLVGVHISGVRYAYVLQIAWKVALAKLHKVAV